MYTFRYLELSSCVYMNILYQKTQLLQMQLVTVPDDPVYIHCILFFL